MVRVCYVCGRKPKRKRGDWFYRPPIHKGRPPEDLVLCKEHGKSYMDEHYSWKNVKKTLTALKRKKDEP